MDVAYDNERLADHPELLPRPALEMAQERDLPSHPIDALTDVLAQRLLTVVGAERREEALGILDIGRLSWRLRDDDNALLGRLESRLLRARRVACLTAGATEKKSALSSPRRSVILEDEIDPMRKRGTRLNVTVSIPYNAPDMRRPRQPRLLEFRGKLTVSRVERYGSKIAV